MPCVLSTCRLTSFCQDINWKTPWVYTATYHPTSNSAQTLLCLLLRPFTALLSTGVKRVFIAADERWLVFLLSTNISQVTSLQRCDGARPICGQCSRANRSEDCQYSDSQGRTKMEILEENISRVETRIRELENPQEQGPSVVLSDPYSIDGSFSDSSMYESCLHSSWANISVYRPRSSSVRLWLVDITRTPS